MARRPEVLLPLEATLKTCVDSIIFSAPLVPKVLDGSKTETRRLNVARWMRRKKGDRLYVRETWRPKACSGSAPGDEDCGDILVTYAADGEAEFFADCEARIPQAWEMPKAAATGNVSPLHMPRWASRCVLELTEAPLVEKLQRLTERAAAAEGVTVQGSRPNGTPRGKFAPWFRIPPGGKSLNGLRPEAGYAWRWEFACLWDDLHGVGSWNEDPEVVVLAFRRVA